MDHSTQYKGDTRLLLSDLKQGEDLPFEYLFHTYYEELCRFACAFVNSMDVAEDIVQDFFIRIWQRRIDLTQEKSLESYLYVSVRNRCVSYLRNHKKHTGIEAIMDRADSVSEEPEEWSKVWHIVDELPSQCKVILKLVVLENMKYADVAEKLEISVNTVKTQMKIAYRILRKKFTSSQLLLVYSFLHPPHT